MENLTEYKIKLPTLPDHLELCGPCFATTEHFLFSWTSQGWVQAKQQDLGYMRHIIARRRETLADWANKQRLFQALAEMRCGYTSRLTHHALEVWELDFYACGSEKPLMQLCSPPANLTGKLRLEAGKWVDA